MKNYFLLFLLAAPVFLFAQTGDIRGFVYNEDNGEPIMFGNVYLEGTAHGAVTDVNGFFSMPGIPVGTYTLTASYIGFDTATVEVIVEEGRIATKKLYIKEQAMELQTVDISAERQEARKEVQISTTKIDVKEIKHLPSIGGEPDIAQYLQVLPGVISTGDQGGRLYIRGGSPVQNKTLLDGMTIYNPFHSIGLFSVFETDIIRSAEVMTGGFNAEYGGRVSSIIDITTRDGNKKEFAGKVSASPFMAKAIVEGPLFKGKDKEQATSTYILTAKHSYLDKTSPVLYSYVDSSGLPYGFTDVYGKVSLSGEGGSKLSLFGFSNDDRVHFATDTLNWNAFGFGSKFVIVPLKSNVLIEGNLAYSNYDIVFEQEDALPRRSGISGFNVGMDFTYYLPEGDLKYGFDFNGFSTVFEFYNFLGIKIDQNQNTTEIGSFVSYRRELEKLIIEPSLRLQYYASLSDLSFEPRIGLKYNLSEKTRLKFAGGRYSQNLISAVSDRDIVNLFVGFLSGPEERLTRPNGQAASHKLQKAWHAIGGVEYDLSRNVQVTAETYIKSFSQIININRYKLKAEESNYMIETGNAYGFDLLAKYEYKRWFVWAVYSLGFVTRDDGRMEYNPHFDRRHNMNFLAAYTFGKDLDWEVNMRWNLGSGFPFTQTQGFYEEIDFTGGINTDYTTENGNLNVIYSEDYNAARLPYYHRLDASVKKKFYITPDVLFEAVGSVINVYNRANVFYVDRISNKRVDQLPVLPSVAVSLSF